MKKLIFEGAATALVTPFKEITENGEKKSVINYEESKKLIDFQINSGIKALVLLGTTGEAATLSETERTEFLEFAIKYIDSRVPVIVGTGSNNTMQAVKLSKEAEKLGADALLVVTPYYNKTTQAGLVIHYSEIAKNTNLPIIVYTVPGRTGMKIEPETCKKLSEIENIVAIKEASGDISAILKIHQLCGNNLHIYSGNDDQIVSIYSVGGKGVISVLSNVYPKETTLMCEALKDNDYKKGLELQEKYLNITGLLFKEVNPIPVKYALKNVGIDAGLPRMPLIELTEANKEKIDLEMEKLND